MKSGGAFFKWKLNVCITTDWQKKNQMFLHSSLLTLWWAKLLNLFNLSKFRDSLEIAQQLLWQQWKCCEKWSSPRRVSQKISKRHSDFENGKRESEVLQPKYGQKRIVDAYVSGGRRHVYLGLEAPSAAENGGSAKNRVTHTVTVLPFFG